MKELALGRRLRRLLVPVVVTSALAVGVSAPATHWLVGKAELERRAHAEAERVAAIVLDAIRERPRLWRYDGAKLRERLSHEGLGYLDALDVRDGRGVRVLATGERGDVAWSVAEVAHDGAPVASVWVGESAEQLRVGTTRLAVGFVGFALVLALLLYLLPSRSIAAAERQLSELMARVALSREEQERRRIARDLHDGAGQALTAARLQLVALRAKLGAEPEPLAAALRHLDEALDEVRRSTTELLPPSLVELGLREAIARHCELYAAATGMRITLECPAQLPEVPPAVQLACFRIAQEALHNAAKHSGARQVNVALSAAAGKVRLEVDDDGERNSAEVVAGAGLTSIRERVALMGGELAFAPSQRGVRVSLPLSE